MVDAVTHLAYTTTKQWACVAIFFRFRHCIRVGIMFFSLFLSWKLFGLAYHSYSYTRINCFSFLFEKYFLSRVLLFVGSVMMCCWCVDILFCARATHFYTKRDTLHITEVGGVSEKTKRNGKCGTITKRNKNEQHLTYGVGIYMVTRYAVAKGRNAM